MTTDAADIQVRVSDVLYHYGVRPILSQLNLDVRCGELLVVMGSNGTGKTTLLGVMAGLLWPVDGYVEIAGMRRRSSEQTELAIRRKVYFLPVDPWLPGGTTGLEFLVAVARLYDVPDLKAMQHAQRLLQLFDLEEKGDSVIGSYSTGQKKKIALAAALASEAPVLILDEPFSGGLDPTGIQALKQVLKGLSTREDVTIIMSTPVPELVEELADRIALLKDGRIFAIGTVPELQKLAETDGPLSEVFERLVQSHTAENIQHYFNQP